MSIYIHFQGTIDFLFLSIDFIMESNSSFINDGSEYNYYVGRVKTNASDASGIHTSSPTEILWA